MYEYCKRFHFALDMNGDLAFTISDAELLFKQAWMLPAKAVVALLHEDRKLASFFEISCATGEGWAGAIFSFFGWFLLFALIVGVADAVDEMWHNKPNR